MINLNNKSKTIVLGALLLLYSIGFYFGTASGRKDAAKAQAELASVKMEHARQAANLSSAHATALKKANDALQVQQTQTAAVSNQLAIANAATKNKANKLKNEVIKNEKNNNCNGIDANGVRLYNTAYGYE